MKGLIARLVSKSDVKDEFIILTVFNQSVYSPRSIAASLRILRPSSLHSMVSLILSSFPTYSRRRQRIFSMRTYFYRRAFP